MRISDWSSDVCSSDLKPAPPYTRCAICPAPGPYLSLRLAADFATDKGRRNNAKAIMTTPRAHAQDSKIATPHRIRAKPKSFFGTWGMFVRVFITPPVMVGSSVPSSPPLIPQLRPQVAWTHTNPSSQHLPGD